MGLGAPGGCLRLQLGHGLLDTGDAALAPSQLLGQRGAIVVRAVLGVLAAIGLLGLLEDAPDLFSQTFGGRLHAPVAHGLVLARVGLDLRAVDGDVVELDHPGLVGDGEHLLEEVGQCVGVGPAELGQGREVGVVVASDDPHGHVGPGRLVDGPRRAQADAPRVDQQRHHHGWGVGPIAPGVLALDSAVDLAQIELIAEIEHEVGEVSLGQPVQWRRREHHGLAWGVRAVGLAAHSP